VIVANKPSAAQKNLERFTELRFQFLGLIRRFNRTPDPAERRRWIRVAYSITYEAQWLCQQHRYELEELKKKLIELPPGTAGETNSKRPKRKAEIVPFYTGRAIQVKPPGSTSVLTSI
jgi:hypothetical protein